MSKVKTDEFVDKVITCLDLCTSDGNACQKCKYQTDDCMVHLMKDAAKTIRAQHKLLSAAYKKNKQKSESTFLIESSRKTAW